MLTYSIKMMFWKIVEQTQVRARVTARAVGPVSFAKGLGGLSLPRVPESCPGVPWLGPPARAAPCTAPTTAEDGGTPAVWPLCSDGVVFVKRLCRTFVFLETVFLSQSLI